MIYLPIRVLTGIFDIRRICALAVILLGGCAYLHPEARPKMAWADRLVKLDTVASLNSATMRHVRLVRTPRPHLALYDPVNSEYPRTGFWISDPQPADFKFTQLIASWNVYTPAKTGMRFFVRTRDARSGQWSPWLYTGYWGDPSPIHRVTKFAGGKVDIDTLELSRPADAWQIRATLESRQTDVAIDPSIRRISVVYSGLTTVSSAQPRKRPIHWAVDLPVPFRAQGDTPPAMRSQTCSPTSVSMVMAYWGKDESTTDNAMAIWDREYHLFGNWNRAVARAGELGLDAWVTRFGNWNQVKRTLAAGQPIIASIEYKRGEFPSSLFDYSTGHLLVIRGMTPDGDIICNDPGSRKFGDNVVYKSADLARVWFGNGGVAYIIKGRRAIGRPRPSTRSVRDKNK